MIKEFGINDILNAVNIISKIEKKRSKILKIEEEKNSITVDEVLTNNNQAKSNKSKILVLNQMIE
jgi:hypothetical protein